MRQDLLRIKGINQIFTRAIQHLLYDRMKVHLLHYIWSAVDRGEVVTERKTRGEGELMLQKQVVTTGH